MELGVVNVLQRHSDWGSNALWCEEIPNVRDPHKTVFFIGGKDDIINPEARPNLSFEFDLISQSPLHCIS